MAPKDPGAQADDEAYDEAIITDGPGRIRRLTPPEYRRLPLGDRIKLILDQTVEFRLRGAVVPTKVALKRG